MLIKVSFLISGFFLIFADLSRSRSQYMREGKIIVVDDNEAVLKTLRILLSREFKTVVTVAVPTLLPALLRKGDVDVVLLDMNFGTGKQSGGEGLFWLDRIRETANPPAVILITAFGDIRLAVSSLKKGAADFVVKPWDNDALVDTVASAWESRLSGKTETTSLEHGSVLGEKETIAVALLNALLKKYAEAYAKPLPRLTPRAIDKLSLLAGNGDLALLQQVVERAVLLVDSPVLDAEDFYTDLLPLSPPDYTLDEMEKQFIAEVLKEKKGNLTLVAQQLDITRQTLYNKMRKYGL